MYVKLVKLKKGSSTYSFYVAAYSAYQKMTLYNTNAMSVYILPLVN